MLKKILIVDDDLDILEATSLLLTDYGYTVKTTPKGDEVIKIAQNFMPDIIILDLLLSGNDGRQICKLVKNGKKTKTIPVIMFSAHPSAEKEAFEFGADGFLPKPFEIEDLLEKVEHFSRKHDI